MLRRALLVCLFVCCCQPALADELLTVCYGYGCLVEDVASISEARWLALAGLLGAATRADEERQVLAEVVGQLYAWAGEQTPIHNDRGGNYADQGVPGGMDCIDHSLTTTRFLLAIERRGLLRWHRVLERQLRTTFIFDHYSAAIEEIGLPAESPAQRYVVDSWFVDNGKPAVILPLEAWKKGAGPNV